MFYEEFLILIDYQQPSDEDIIYVPINRDRGQNQKVYTFDYLGVTRPALSKEINKMIKEGLISVDKREVTLLNMQGLKEYI